MAVLEPLILPPDVEIVPIDQLPAALRDRLDHSYGDCAVTRPLTRATSTVVDAQTAALLLQFRAPSTIVDAVIAHSNAHGVDPRATLDAAFEVLGGFVNDGLLVPPDSELAQPIESTLIVGASLGGFEVLAPLQVIADTTVHRGRARDGEPVALKVARDGSQDAIRRALAHEAAILASLDGRVTPRLVGSGEADGLPFLATSWCAGVDVHEAAEEARRFGGPAARAELLALADAVLAAYAQLHSQGVLHGDVHPRNVLVGGDRAITIIDFGLAVRTSVRPDRPAAGGRGGVDLFLEPEVAQARIARRRSPEVSVAGEQYSVAALVYLVLTGAHTHAFALEQDEMLRQLVEDAPVPFARSGVTDLRAVERIVRRALAKRPGERYTSVAELLSAFREAVADDSRAVARRAARQDPRPARLLADEVLAGLGVPGAPRHHGSRAVPGASIHNGAAGVAYALLRVAGIRGDAALLAQADLWCQRALRDALTPAGFRDERGEILPEQLGERSLYHGPPGVHAVAGLVARGMCDERSQQVALDAFVDAVGEPSSQVDVGFGRSGLLIGCALLLEGRGPQLEVEPLRALGDALRDSLVAELADQPEIAACETLRPLGAAHGWAGLLFALLRWSAATGSVPADGVAERLAQLTALGEPVGRGMRWPHSTGDRSVEHALGGGWCSGAAGYVPLWTLADSLIGGGRFGRLALAAAWTAYEDPADDIASLCCGLAGRAYALLNIYRHGGGDVWLARARDLADRAALRVRRQPAHGELGEPAPRTSLYAGALGVALLAADLDDPGNSCMPLYEAEGWHTVTR